MSSFLDQLNPVQRQAVETVDGPVMIIAGAGSGKTRVLTYRVAHLLSLGVRPESVLALTFTNKAADEMKGRIVALVGGDSKDVWMGTFHSIFARILRREAEHLGYQRNFTIYDTDDSLSQIRSIMNSLEISQQQFPAQAIRTRISMAKNRMMSAQELQKSSHDPLVERTAAVFEEYERRLRTANAMDFDDLLLKPLQLFLQHPEILQRYQYRFRYILVDEYQDTNRVQYLLIRELAKQFRNICVVGDDAQSIYAFRGADIRNILDFEKDYPDCKIFRLEQNYRSTQTILSAAGSLIRHNVDQIEKNLWTGRGNGEQIILHVCEDDRDEGRKVVATIEEESLKRKLDLKDFAVLYRTNAQSRALEDALRRRGLPYTIVGGVAFYKRQEIKDVLAYLRLIANPRDSESLLRIINVPSRAIGQTTVEKLMNIARQRQLPLLEAVAAPELREKVSDRTWSSLQRFHTLIRKYVKLKDAVSVGELARALVDEAGLLNALKLENTMEAQARQQNIEELVSALSEFTDTRPQGTLEDFLEEVSLISDVDTADLKRNAVTLMTLHAAKGLEYPVVFITGLEEGLLPLSNAISERRELEEERRLMYVGITRAKDKLVLMYARSRYRFGELSASVRSRFLEEIDPSLITAVNGSTHRPARSGTERASTSFTSYPRHATPERRTVDPMPDYESESQVPLQAAVGQRVEHESFGRGRIVAIDGRGDNMRAVVDFESVGRKHLMLKYANLKLR